ncbi:hypothetical protein C8R48DRAFT_44502 [Suillus tomentosus]|nr:hypothetical protein C8R48DRAFT_44502 [Suillus tomentosus]
MNKTCYALSQVALTGVSCRRYIRPQGPISEEEWNHRKRHSCIFTGGPNLRPYQDMDWFQTFFWARAICPRGMQESCESLMGRQTSRHSCLLTGVFPGVLMSRDKPKRF